MVEFMSGYEPPMDRQWDEQPIEALETNDIETPIIPISELGTTVIDTGQGNILSNLEQSIRIGTKKIQLIISGESSTGPGQLASVFGKDVRREIKERAMVSDVKITGVELSPGKIQGLTGWNPQQGGISEEERAKNLQEVKNAIEFAADVADGGGVDIYANEFQRDILDADWNKDKNGKKLFYSYSQNEIDDPDTAETVKFLIDGRTGRAIQGSVIRTNDDIFRVQFKTAKDENIVGKKDRKGNTLKADDFVDIEGNKVDQFTPEGVSKLLPVMNPDTKEFVTEKWDWKRVREETEKYNKANNKDVKPEEFAFRQKLLSQMALAHGQALHWNKDLDYAYEGLRNLSQMKHFAEDIEDKMGQKEKEEWIEHNLLRGRGIPDSMKRQLLKEKPSKVVQDMLTRDQNQLHGLQEQALSYQQNFKELEQVWENIRTPSSYAKNKTFDSYAEAGMHAYKITKERKLGNPVYVGPEIGFAGASYGSHPDEFIEMIKGARDHMKQKLMEKGMDQAHAKDVAKQHIKGMMDTTHLSNWYSHFAEKKGETDADKLSRFNKWMKAQANNMVKEGVLGGIQVVDSMTGEHAHLPVGQGIFDMVGMVKDMKAAGFKGDILSEGHEEEGFGRGRILTETWRAFGSPIGNTSAGAPTFGGIQNAYMGHTMPTNYVVGGYAPSPEWTLWSETPME
ncbi:hypothetical protein GOV11_01990 [Candidatus Woesearchaeota archaeon]|nr:hypothetical protein [Candidatus Woesearchaeota archaeon]